ncbi:unnamed protein product [Rotaria socialis]
MTSDNSLANKILIYKISLFGSFIDLSVYQNLFDSLISSGSFIFASHRVSSLFKDISQRHIATTRRMPRSLEERR